MCTLFVGLAQRRPEHDAGRRVGGRPRRRAAGTCPPRRFGRSAWCRRSGRASGRTPRRCRASACSPCRGGPGSCGPGCPPRAGGGRARLRIGSGRAWTGGTRRPARNERAAVEIVEVQAAAQPPVEVGADRDHPRVVAGPEQVEQQPGQREVAEVVGGEDPSRSPAGSAAGRLPADAGVVDQHVDRAGPARAAGPRSAVPSRGRPGRARGPRGRRAARPARGGLCSGFAHRHDHLRAARGELRPRRSSPRPLLAPVTTAVRPVWSGMSSKSERNRHGMPPRHRERMTYPLRRP